MDDVQATLTRIVDRITASSLPDGEKAECMVQLAVGMRKLVWPILLSHVPEYLLEEATSTSQMTVDAYEEIIGAALSNPATPKEIHDELIDALSEVERTVTKALG